MFMRHERQTWRIPAQYECPLLLLLLLYSIVVHVLRFVAFYCSIAFRLLLDINAKMLFWSVTHIL